jgi:hypothetical protein
MKFVLTVIAHDPRAARDVVRDRCPRQDAAAAPEQATVLVVPGLGGACVPRVARPVIRTHMDDTIEWGSVELPGCEGQGAFAIEAGPDEAGLFAPPLRKGSPVREHAARVTHRGSERVTVTYAVELRTGSGKPRGSSSSERRRRIDGSPSVPAGAAVSLGKVEPERADLAEERALVDAQGPGGGEAVEAVPLEGLADEPGFGGPRRLADGRGGGDPPPAGRDAWRQVPQLQPLPVAQHALLGGGRVGTDR